MLRGDGKYTVFYIQHDYDKKGRWVNSNVDAILFDRDRTTFEWRTSAEARRIRDMIREYGNAWQETGLNATFSEEAAIHLMREMVMRVPRHNYRVVRVDIEQKMTVIETISRDVPATV